MTDTIMEIVVWAFLLTGIAVCICAGFALVALLTHVVTQWLWEKLKAAYSLERAVRRCSGMGTAKNNRRY